MSFTVKSYRTSIRSLGQVASGFGRLTGGGYRPVFQEAQTRFLSTMKPDYQSPLPLSGEPLDTDLMSEPRIIWLATRKWPGEVFRKDGTKGLFYLRLLREPAIQDGSSTNQRNFGFRLSAGFFGDSEVTTPVDDFLQTLGDNPASGMTFVPTSPVRSERFARIKEEPGATFLSAKDIPASDIEAARALENRQLREIAIDLRQSGGLQLAEPGDSDPKRAACDHLTKIGLADQDHLVKCRKSGKALVRVREMEALGPGAKHGFRCHECGLPVSEEEHFLYTSATERLRTLMDHSYWMTAWLADRLICSHVKPEEILLNRQDVTEEVDGFLNLFGKLVMIEMKDGDFSRGHAYPLLTRIGLYKPDHAIIVVSGHVGGDARAEFDRAKPKTKLHLVEGLSELDGELLRVGSEIQGLRAFQIIEAISRVATFQTTSAQLLTQDLGLTVSEEEDEEREFVTHRDLED